MKSQQQTEKRPLVVLLGDSIRMGYQDVVVRELGRQAVVWAPKENGAHTVHTLGRIDEWLADKDPAVIHINCGLHDMWRNEDGSIRYPLDTYQENLRAIFRQLAERAPQATVLFALTTPVDQERQKTSNYGRIVRYDADIPRYNAAAQELAQECGLPVNDLYAAVMAVGRDRLIHTDGVHFNAEGYEVLGKAVARAVSAALA